jgi:hypothetical protein
VLRLVLLASASVAVACAGVETSSDDGGGGAGASGTGANGGEGGAGGDPCTPGTEICDGKDNDCDEQIDEVAGGCACNDGEVQDCYTGPRGTENVGECHGGTQTCEDGQWSACEDEVLPGRESCNSLDDDCNDAEDDMGTQSCGNGACMATVDVCVDGQTQQCVPGQPGLEVCDGIDNNCNQLIDESDPVLNQACDSGLFGVCQAGTNQCINAAIDCVPNQMAGSEACDSLDNDCDGTVDNNVPGTGGACNTGQFGVCAQGTVSCQGGTVDCFPNTPASTEICDLVDNDCNGQTDEDDPQMGNACMTGQPGVCAAGSIDCNGGVLQCVPNALGSAEICNGIDDDCDGTPDDGNPGGGQACGCGGSGTTACVNGSVTCQGGPTVFFSEDFSDNSAGWTLGTNWSIGPTVMSAATGSCGIGDPASDHSPTADNGVAGNVLGGNLPQTIAGPNYLTSPVFNTAGQANVVLEYWRWLHSDYPNFMIDRVEVWNGSSWVLVWQNPAGVVVNDTAWTKMSHNITAYANANMQIRFSYQTGSGVYLCAGWNIDDIYVGSAACP